MNVENRTLFIADNLDIMRGMDSEIIDLIYLDPTFNTKKQYKAPIGSPAEGAEFKDIWTDEDVKDGWYSEIAELYPHIHQIIQAAEHTYDKSMMIYLMAMGIRLIEMQRLLTPTGSIYLHCDPTASHYLKLIMDDIFGKNNFRNEIVWCYTGPGSPKMRQFNRSTIYFSGMLKEIRGYSIILEIYKSCKSWFRQTQRVYHAPYCANSNRRCTFLCSKSVYSPL